eukprot:CFRG4331T1
MLLSAYYLSSMSDSDLMDDNEGFSCDTDTDCALQITPYPRRPIFRQRKGSMVPLKCYVVKSQECANLSRTKLIFEPDTVEIRLGTPAEPLFRSLELPHAARRAARLLSDSSSLISLASTTCGEMCGDGEVVNEVDLYDINGNIRSNCGSNIRDDAVSMDFEHNFEPDFLNFGVGFGGSQVQSEHHVDDVMGSRFISPGLWSYDSVSSYSRIEDADYESFMSFGNDGDINEMTDMLSSNRADIVLQA